MKTLPAKKIASAYKFSDRLVLHSQARTPAGFDIACEPYLTLSLEAATEEVGCAVHSVLAGFRPEIPQPKNLKQVTVEFLFGIGVKSNKKLQESSVCCGIAEQDGNIEFQPKHNGGTSGNSKGFRPIPNAKISLPANSPYAEIGAVLLKGFSVCTTIYQ
jgi:hypothetical protein